jgi:hypothetical protein
LFVSGSGGARPRSRANDSNLARLLGSPMDFAAIMRSSRKVITAQS